MAKILIVDDDNTITALFQYLFQEANYKTETAKNGQEALEKLASFVPDIMIVDIEMPVMNGPEFIKKLHEKSLSKPGLKNIPFIVMTCSSAKTIGSDYGFGGNKCCKAFLPKMTPPETVLEIANQIIEAVNSRQ
ncbi:MAG: response regulator [Elusimicrobia bacterium]|nr:response regulator [Elusimicrobiota bacterium]